MNVLRLSQHLVFFLLLWRYCLVLMHTFGFFETPTAPARAEGSSGAEAATSPIAARRGSPGHWSMSLGHFCPVFTVSYEQVALCVTTSSLVASCRQLVVSTLAHVP